jgi:acyl carrier protein
VDAIKVLPYSTNQELKDRIRHVVKQHAGVKLALDAIDDTTDLYRAGMSSQGSVVLMIALESEFDFEFPDSLLSRDVFANVNAIASAIGRGLQACA